MAPLSAYFSYNLLTSRRSSSTSGSNTRTESLPIRQADAHLENRGVTKPPQNAAYNPGSGTIDPHHVNNHAFFALFALIGVAFVLASIWFFFWAKNGGFHFRQGDWDDYKSTVLRRKGPNGTTLSGATKTTRLGGGSVVADGGEADMSEKGWKRGEQGGKKKGRKPRGNKNNDDADVQAYRHEKPAKVGGLNRESDGIFNHGIQDQDFAYSDNTYSDDISSQGVSVGGHVPINTPKKKEGNRWTKPKKPATAATSREPSTPSPKKKGGFYNQTPNSNASSDSHRPLRPNGQSPAGFSTPSRSRQTSPTKGSHSRHSGFRDYTEPLDFESRYSASDAGMTEDSRGTKAYHHPIPGLGNAQPGASFPGGFRRGRGRRDSLSDSEGETVMS